tara:strand:- start:2102 stop:2284 length:183 start_codon:yes stop_codon:yes gene_type:complete
MENKKKIFFTIICIYLLAVTTAVAFLVFLVTGEFMRAAVVLLIELALLYIGKTLRRQWFL